MSVEKSREIAANLERAVASIKAAKDLLKGGYSDFAASRSYYAAFYAATALLINEGFQFKKHSAVIAAIHKNFVKTRKLDKNQGKNLNLLFELRSVGDYGMMLHVPQEDAEKRLKLLNHFWRLQKN